jgi:hypothetical protein
MVENKVSAASNPNLVNSTVEGILAEPEKIVAPASIESPSNVLVNLPAGFVTPDGEVIKTAEVRELNGKDEEAIARASGWFRAFGTILSRAVVKLGDTKIEDALMDRLILGDRDALLLGIYKATFGSTTILRSYCSGCDDTKDVEVDVDRDIPVTVLVDPLLDRNFVIKTGKHEYVVTLPTGIVQREIGNNSDRTTAELTTLMLEHCVLEIDGSPVLGKAQVQAIGVADRRELGEAIARRTPGPQFDTTTIDCPDCGGKVAVPINLGTLFQF